MKRLAERPFAFLGINSDSDREKLKRTLEQERITWRSWWDAGKIDGPIQTRWDIQQRPVIYVLDGEGVIRYKDVTREELDRAVDRLLEEMADRSKKSPSR